jgi:phosphoribosylformimino-5-aminoimidazole carboxamide ribotide isomerase
MARLQGRRSTPRLCKAIAARYPDLPIQIGGGIRNLESIQFYLDAGVSYVIIGTAAVKDPDFVRAACLKFPGKIIVGIDAIDGMVATDGWADVSEVLATDLVAKFADYGVEAIVYTDIARDGMMKGVNIEATQELAQDSAIPIIASGGLSKLADVAAIREAADTETGAGIMGVITGSCYLRRHYRSRTRPTACRWLSRSHVKSRISALASTLRLTPRIVDRCSRCSRPARIICKHSRQ